MKIVQNCHKVLGNDCAQFLKINLYTIEVWGEKATQRIANGMESLGASKPPLLTPYGSVVTPGF